MSVNSSFRENSAYSEAGAPTGQVSAQEPQSMQVFGSIAYCVSPWEIADTGHASAQAPQLMQESEILYAMIKHLQKYVYCFSG